MWRPWARNSASRRAVLLSPMMTLFPPPQVEPRHRCLVGHTARQTEAVYEGGLVARVAPEARAAQRGPEHRRVDRDDAAIPGGWVIVHAHLLVLVLREESKEIEPVAFPGLTPGVSNSPSLGGRDRGRR